MDFIQFMKKGSNFKNYIIILCVVIFVVILGVLVFRNFSPFGKIVIYRFTSKLPGAQEVTFFSPSKDNILKIPAQIITTNKSKMQIELLSSNIESIKATLKFKPTVNEILLGARGNEKDNFNYRPLYRDLIYQMKWSRVEENGISLWQKGPKYNTVSDFVGNPPLDKITAFYFIDQDKLPKPQTSQTKNNTTRIISTPLRGSHNLLVKVDTSPLVIKVNKQDMNSYEGEDKLKITVSGTEKKLVEKTIGDDGITEASRLKTQPQEETITLSDVVPGIYQVDLIYEGKGDDVLINKIEVNQAKVIFKNYVLFLGNKPTIIWTSAKKVFVVTAHKEGFQTIKLDDKYSLEIKEDGKVYGFDLESLTGKKGIAGLYKLESPKNDLAISGAGYFSFSEDTFFLPEIVKGIELNDLGNLDNVDYLLTSYTYPKKEGDWLIAEAELNPKDLKIDGNKLYFSLEIPQISKYGGELEIDYLEIVVKNRGILELKASPEPSKQEADKSTPSENKRSFPNLGQIFKNLFDQLSEFFTSLLKQPFPSKTIPTPSPTPATIPTPTPTPTSTPTPINIKVSVLNGGAVIGTAAKFAEVLKKAGFSSVVAANADNLNYKNVTLRFRSDDKSTAEKIAELLKTDYSTIEMKEIATTSAEIVVILGSK